MNEPSGHARVAALDGLRGLAAYIVVVAHVSNATGLWGNRLGAGGGQIGVMLFFVLSGYLMAAIYLHRPFRHRLVWNYAVHRVARVVPLFYLIVLTALSLNSIASRIGMPSPLYGIGPGNAAATLAFVKAPDVLWTVPVEIQFYVVFIGIWWLRAKSPAVATGSLLVALCVAMLWPLDLDRSFGSLAFHVAFFLTGVLVGVSPPGLRRRLNRQPLPLLIAALLPLAILLAPRLYTELFGAAGQVVLLPDRDTWHQPLYLLVASGCLIAALASPLASRALATRPMTYLGRISYSLYLVHMPVVILLLQSATLTRRPVMFLLAATALAVGASAVLHRWLEQPLQTRLNRWLAAPAAVPRDRIAMR